MAFLLSAKSGEVTSRRAVEEFAASYRQALLDLASSDRGAGAEAVFSETCTALETDIATHKELLKRLLTLIEEVSEATPPASIRELTVSFYDDLYRHFGRFRSAPAFYQLSSAFLRRASAALIAQTTEQLGLPAGHLPEMALIAVGPAGRCEYSPFCPLQILLVHGEATESQLAAIDLFCHTLHAGFDAAGLAVDPAVTPRNSDWRGTLPDWRQRCEDGVHSEANEELIDLCRLVDQYPLYPDEGGSGRELKEISSAALRGSHAAVANLIERMTSLSNGLGLMGGFKLERSGSERGLFRLLYHGLLPLSASLSALALIKESPAVGSCERIHDLLKRRELDVELAERMLATWHTIHGLRLKLEQSFHIDGHTNPSLCLNPNELTGEQKQSLKDALESVAIIQRHVDIIFSGMGE